MIDARKNKKLLKEYLKDKVECLVSAEENLAYSNEIIQDLTHKYDTINYEKDRLENEYKMQFENIVSTLSSLKVYDRDTIESDSLLEIINRSLREIKQENDKYHSIKADYERLLKVQTENDELKQKFYKLKSDYSNLSRSKNIENMKKQFTILIKNKLDTFKSEIR